jgi:hypothetical protein
VRHQKKDLLHFRLEPQENQMVSEAKLNLFVHNEKWLKHNEPSIFKQLNGARNIDISIYRLSARVSQNKNMDGKMFQQLIYKIENVTLDSGSEDGENDGRYIQTDLTQTVQDWLHNPQSNHGIHIRVNASGTNSPVSKIVSVDLNNGEIVSISVNHNITFHRFSEIVTFFKSLITQRI